MNFTNYLNFVRASCRDNPEHRFGQVCFNILYELDPNFASTFTGTSIDPFFDDTRTPEFLIAVRKRLDD